MSKKILCLFLSILFVLSFASCGKTEETPLVQVDATNDSVSYSLIYPEIGSVIKTKDIECLYMQTKEQEVCFDSTGKYVDKVYVRKGDTVKKGDLLCELSYSALEEEIENLTYKVTKNELLLSYLDTNENLAIQDVWIPTIINPYYDKSDIEKSVENVRKDYDRQRVLINDALEFDRKELAKKQAELKSSRLYASLDGIVYSIDSNLEGSTSKKDKVIMTIVDNTDCIFTVSGTEYKDYFKEGEHVNMKISYSKAAGDYILDPVDSNSWDDKIIFALYDGPEEAQLEVGSKGYINLELERKDNVLTLSKIVLHEIESQYYVYVLNENGVREIRYIEVGLIGDDCAEIISGLSEGDKVIKK